MDNKRKIIITALGIIAIGCIIIILLLPSKPKLSNIDFMCLTPTTTIITR